MYSELKSITVEKCRKPHRCAWCDELIEKGETAHYRTYTYDDCFHSEHMHPECFDALNDYTATQKGEFEFDGGEFVRGSMVLKDEVEIEGEGGEVEMKCPDCGGEVTYYHPCIVHGDGITRVVCSKKCKGWKVMCKKLHPKE